MPNQINLPRCTNLWTEQDRDLFNRLPIYMAKLQVDRIPFYSRFTKVLKPQKWSPNMGDTMQGVRKVNAPVLRSQVFPNRLSSMPRKDVIEVRETSEKCLLFRHNFESNMLNFLPHFQDFLTDHIEFHTKDITDKVQIFAEQFYRTAIFHAAPYVWICGKAPGTELTATNYWTDGNVSEAKTQANLQALTAQVTKTLDLRTFAKLATVMYTDLGIVPFSGSVAGDGADGSALKQKYCAIIETEVWDNFIDDPFLVQMKTDSLNVLTNGFSGSLFGRFTTLHERFGMRIREDGSMPAPETVEENPAAYNRGEALPADDYVGADFGTAYFCGAEGYKFVQVGPPPKEFNKDGMSMKHFNGLSWNGKVEMTQDLLVNCLNQHDVVVQDTNKRGEFLQLLADIALGILPIQRRNIIPVLYERQRIAQ
jgi:hypothetical protein